MKRIYLIAIILLGFSVYMGCKKDDENFSCGDTFIDPRDGLNYNTVLIGDQCWMAENLNVGEMINDTDEMTDDGVIEKYCYYNFSGNCDEYGGLYQWDEMMQYSWIPGTQGICPDGWHLPKDDEWITLSDFLGGVSVAGGKMKETGSIHWFLPNTGATNESGFTALPGGYLPTFGNFVKLTSYASFWSSSYCKNYSFAWGMGLSNTSNDLYRSHNNKIGSFSVRCLKD